MADYDINSAIDGCEHEIRECEEKIIEKRGIVEKLEQLEEKLRYAKNRLYDYKQEQIGKCQQLCNGDGDPRSVVLAQSYILNYASGQAYHSAKIAFDQALERVNHKKDIINSEIADLESQIAFFRSRLCFSKGMF